MPPAGGAEPLLGTNPLAIAIPAGEEAPVVLDIATSVVSYGTIKNHRLQGRELERDWMVDPATGAPITDPAKSMEGLLLPLGGYKGAGLALMLGLLGGTLNRAPFGRDVIDFNAHPDRVTNTGQFVVALDVARFQPFGAFAAEVDRQMVDMRASKPLPGHDAVRLPGEQRAKRRATRTRDGLPLTGELVAQLDKVAAELGIRRLGER
jgi:LDH2 family malate/lactate/ureidoglycolate dehydrogenase